MTTFGDMVYAFGGVPLMYGIPFGPNSRAFFVDPANGLSTNDGLSLEAPLDSVATAYAKTTSGNNDAVIFIGGATGDTLTETLVWANSYTHLIGISSGLPGLGQRCSITGGATTDITEVMTISGSGCVFRNLQISNWADANADSGAATVSGSRNEFTNVFFAGMGHATPAARAGAYSLKVSGSENFFQRCTIGLDTIIRAAANAELHVSGGRNKFWQCELRSQSVTAGKFLVKIDNSGDDLRDTEFRDCYFFNHSANWAGGIDNIFDMPAAGNTHWVALVGNNTPVGLNNAANATMGWGNVVTHIYSAAPAPNAGFGISVNPTT
jgi:hypothetical protein